MVYNGNTYDLVKKYFADPQTTIEAFDFTVSMFAVDNEKIYHGETSFIDLAKRQLMFNKITYSASSLSRAFRYYKKGFTMCLGEMKKLFDAIQNTPIEEPEEKPETQTENKTEGDVSSGDFRAMGRLYRTQICMEEQKRNEQNDALHAISVLAGAILPILSVGDKKATQVIIDKIVSIVKKLY